MTIKHWKTENDDNGVMWLCLDSPDAKANVLSSVVLGELNELVAPLTQSPPQGLVIWSGKQESFVMGADINEFTLIETSEQAYEQVRLGQQLMDRIEALECPTVTVVNGVCMGGGLELAMACDYRIAYKGDKKILGLPEVKLGLHPGFGGTVRTVQICGVRAGMSLMLTGNPVTPGKAMAIGLVDRLTSDADWREDAMSLIRSAPAKQRAPLLDRIMNVSFVRPLVRNLLLKQVRGKARKEHYPAPYAMIDIWTKDGASSETGYEVEARSFAELMCTDTSRNLVRVFFLQSRLKAQGNKTDKRISHVHVVGAGVMGGDIAAWCALRGHTVTLQDREQKYIDPAIERGAKLFAKRIRNDDERTATSARLKSDLDGDGVAKADLIIEAIIENLEAKQGLYKALQEKMKPGALLATNTSSIRLEELRTVLREPRRFIGLHFFNPVAMLPLVEVIRCEDTEQDALDIGFAFTKGIGKFPLECASSPGFVVNRILAPYMGEAMHLAEDGVPLAAIDEVAVKFGMPMGPVELADSVGLDVALHVSKVLGAALNRPVSAGLQKMVDDGLLGRKSGQGYYRWENGKAVKPAAKDFDLPEDVEDRLILSMVNEAVACLHEGVVTDADLLDAGVIFGTGFAPFRGGPLHYARHRGTTSIVMRLNELAKAHGERFEPHSGWSEL
ncbi:MAG TPA: 3-hydroxyacyl-CoA dehydrogenase NAD-binding domain-containing protein [Woeseiaceae bacterium]|nr:3-hydroxyacyl-CoA dehydrogenase NAD-binding domain-containing protein [Woeseiaceae bacterium]